MVRPVLVHLVRHGQSTWNLQRRLQGQRMDVPLTGLGLTQAHLAAETLSRTGAAVVHTSDQLRALTTAQIIAGRIGIEARPTPELREQALGRLEGMSYDDLVEEPVPPGCDVSEVRWGGGESVQDVHARLTRFADELRAGPHEEVIVVSHGDALRILLAVFDGRSHREVEWAGFGNGEILTYALDRGSRQAG